jgi:ribosomal protein L24
MDVSKVQLVDTKLNRPVRVNFKIEEKDGKRIKVRWSKKLDITLD